MFAGVSYLSLETKLACRALPFAILVYLFYILILPLSNMSCIALIKYVIQINWIMLLFKHQRLQQFHLWVQVVFALLVSVYFCGGATTLLRLKGRKFATNKMALSFTPRTNFFRGTTMNSSSTTETKQNLLLLPQASANTNHSCLNILICKECFLL